MASLLKIHCSCRVGLYSIWANVSQQSRSYIQPNGRKADGREGYLRVASLALQHTPSNLYSQAGE